MGLRRGATDLSPMPSPIPSVLQVVVQQPVAPMHWTDVLTAIATTVLAVFAIISAVFAGRLWVEARKARDVETALRMLDRCDNPDLLYAEIGLSFLVRDGILRDLKTFNDWFATRTPETKKEIMRQHSLILNTYEHVGIVVRKYPGAAPLLVDYLSLRAPLAFNAMKVFIDQDRTHNPIVHGEFENLARACERFSRTGADGTATA